MSKSKTFTYNNTTCVNVVDGDTLDFVIDLGFSILHKVRVRLNGLDTAEVNDKDTEQRELALLAKKFVQDKVLNKPCTLITFSNKDKYGRHLAEVYYLDETGHNRSLNNALLANYLAKIYDSDT